MHSEDEYLECTPDLVAKVRVLRNAAQQQMDRFTCVSDYNVRRVVGQGTKPVPVSIENNVTDLFNERSKNSSGKSASTQASPESAPAPAERAGDGEDQ